MKKSRNTFPKPYYIKDIFRIFLRNSKNVHSLDVSTNNIDPSLYPWNSLTFYEFTLFMI